MTSVTTTQMPATEPRLSKYAAGNEPAAVDAAGISAAPHSVSAWVPRLSAWMLGLAIIAGAVGAYAPKLFTLPQAFAWLEYPSSLPIAGLFCFGFVLALFRALQCFVWMLSRSKWGPLADRYAQACLAGANEGVTPEAMQVSAFQTTFRAMRSAILFPHWLLFATCFVLLVAAIPMFLLHLQALGRQTDFLDALWIPGLVILGGSAIWLLTIFSSTFAARAIQHWYDDAMLAYSMRHAAAQAELEEVVQATVVNDTVPAEDDGFGNAGEFVGDPPRTGEDRSYDPGYAGDDFSQGDDFGDGDDFGQGDDFSQADDFGPGDFGDGDDFGDYQADDGYGQRAGQASHGDAFGNDGSAHGRGSRAPGAGGFEQGNAAPAGDDFDDHDDDEHFDPTA